MPPNRYERPTTTVVILAVLGALLGGIIAPTMGILWGNQASSPLGTMIAVATSLAGVALLLTAIMMRRRK